MTIISPTPSKVNQANTLTTSDKSSSLVAANPTKPAVTGGKLNSLSYSIHGTSQKPQSPVVCNVADNPKRPGPSKARSLHGPKTN